MQQVLRWLGLCIAALAFAACTSSAHSVAGRGSTAAHGASTDRGGAAAVAADDIPACFIEGEPAAAAGPERAEVFQPAQRPATSTPQPGAAITATPRPTPQVATIATQAPFPLYALNVPASEAVPLQMRVSTIAAGASRQVSLFSLQYRLVAQRGSIAIVTSSPSSAKAPAPNDVDDAIDAIRLEARLPGTPRPADPLTDPGAALRSVGCPTRERMMVQIEGQAYPALLITWPGLPRIEILRAETGHGALIIEAGAIDRASVLALTARLVSLQNAPAVVAALQGYFGGASLSSPVVAGRTATPVRQRAVTSAAVRVATATPVSH